MSLPRRPRHHIARHCDWQIGIVGRAVAQLAIGIISPSRQCRIPHCHQYRQADDHPTRIRHHYIISAGIGHACVCHRQRAVRCAQKQPAVLEPLIRRQRVARRHAQRERRAHGQHLICRRLDDDRLRQQWHCAGQKCNQWNEDFFHGDFQMFFSGMGGRPFPILAV